MVQAEHEQRREDRIVVGGWRVHAARQRHVERLDGFFFVVELRLRGLARLVERFRLRDAVAEHVVCDRGLADRDVMCSLVRCVRDAELRRGVLGVPPHAEVAGGEGCDGVLESLAVVCHSEDVGAVGIRGAVEGDDDGGDDLVVVVDELTESRGLADEHRGHGVICRYRKRQ